PRSGCSEPPGAVVVRIIIGPEVLIVAKDRLERCRVRPLIDLLPAGPAAAKIWVANYIGPAGQLIAGSADRHRQTALRVEVARQTPASDHRIHSPVAIAQELPVFSEG